MRRRTTTTQIEEILDTSTDPSAPTTFPGEYRNTLPEQDRTSSVALPNTETTGTTKTDNSPLPHGRTPSDLIADFQTSWRGMGTILMIGAFLMSLYFIEIKSFTDWIWYPIVFTLFLWGAWFGIGCIESKWRKE